MLVYQRVPITRLPLSRAGRSTRADDAAAGESPVDGVRVDSGSYTGTCVI